MRSASFVRFIKIAKFLAEKLFLITVTGVFVFNESVPCVLKVVAMSRIDFEEKNR